MAIRWMVIRQIEIDPPEVYPFEEREPAEKFFEDASGQWSEVYLCQVIKPIRNKQGNAIEPLIFLSDMKDGNGQKQDGADPSRGTPPQAET